MVKVEGDMVRVCFHEEGDMYNNCHKTECVLIHSKEVISINFVRFAFTCIEVQSGKEDENDGSSNMGSEKNQVPSVTLSFRIIILRFI